MRNTRRVDYQDVKEALIALPGMASDYLAEWMTTLGFNPALGAKLCLPYTQTVREGLIDLRTLPSYCALSAMITKPVLAGSKATLDEIWKVGR